MNELLDHLGELVITVVVSAAAGAVGGVVLSLLIGPFILLGAWIRSLLD